MNTEKQQCLLAYLGYYNLRYTQPPRNGDLAIDRIPGPSLTSAIKRFQTDNELTADGIIGEQTLAILKEAVANDRFAKEAEPTVPQEAVPDAVWRSLMAFGFPAVSVAGIMGNLDAESAMRSDNMEDQYQSRLGYTDQTYTQAVDDGSYPNFVHDRVGYGLCQWTWHTRKKKLLEFAKAKKVSIADPTMQTEFLIREMRESYPSMVSRLMQCKSVYSATRDFMLTFEQPYDQSDRAVAVRASMSQRYYDRYAEG